MKIICSTVVRAAKQGDIHGGLYIIDVDSEKVEKYIPYSDSFINDNERGGERGLRGICVLKDRIIVADSAGLFQLDRKNYEIINRVNDSLVFKSIHEICYLDGYIWVTSTAYDAIVQVDLNFNICNIYKINGRSLHDYKVLESKDSVSKSDLTNDDNFHINSISSENGRVVFSGLITHLYDLETMNVVSAMPTLNGSKSFQHNFYEYEDFSLVNLTSFKYLGINKDVGCDFIVIPRSRNVKYHVDTIAENNWNRGLARSGDIVFVGSSPARILMLDIRTQKLLKEIQLEEDIRHCIHGLEVLK